MDDVLKGNWKQLKGKVQEEWGELTGDEVDQIQGIRTRLEGKLQEKYGHTKMEAKEAVDDWLDSLDDEDYDDDVYDA